MMMKRLLARLTNSRRRLNETEGAGEPGAAPRRLYAFANTHGTVTGWLVDFAKERSYVINNHVDHIKKLESDPNYHFVVSEVPNLMALKELAPESFDSLMDNIRGGRAEIVNAFFLEQSGNIVGGETLMRSGIEAASWIQSQCGAAPKIAWMIDLVGIHAQLPAIVAHLGLEMFVYCRNCPTDSVVHWWRSDSGARILSVCFGAGYYSNWRPAFTATGPIPDPVIEQQAELTKRHLAHAPKGDIPILWPIAAGDYSGPPADPSQPKGFLDSWRRLVDGITVTWAGPNAFLKTLRDEAKCEVLPEHHGDSLYSYNAFWANNPTIKRRFRHAEQRLMAVESAAALASITPGAGASYPAAALRDAWLMLLLNSDRGLIWGIGHGDAFYGNNTWNAADRFFTLHRILDDVFPEVAAPKYLFNAVASEYQGPLWLKRDVASDSYEDEILIPSATLRGAGTMTTPATAGPRRDSSQINDFAIKTPDYEAKICPNSGDIVDFVLPGWKRPAYPAIRFNSVRFERQDGVQLKEDYLAHRSQRLTLCRTAETKAETRIRDEKDYVRLESISEMAGAEVRRHLTFHKAHPFIDAEIVLSDVADDILVSVDFTLPYSITREARGVPYGCSERDPRCVRLPADDLLMDDHATIGLNTATAPANRWSWHGIARGAGIGILDRGIPGRESNGDTASLLLINTSAGYRGKPNAWMSGRGQRRFRYAFVPTADGWRAARLPLIAQVFNSPLIPSQKEIPAALLVRGAALVESMRRTGPWLEIRLVESDGEAGTVFIITRDVPHTAVFAGTAVSRGSELRAEDLDGALTYRLNLLPQEIVTVRLELAQGVADPAPRMNWIDLVPEEKRAAFNHHDPALRGHPA